MQGFERVFEFVDDLEIDAPGAASTVAAFLARAVVDEVLPPSFLIDPTVVNLGGDVVEMTKRMLSRDHQHSRRGQRRHRAEDPHMTDIVEKFGHQQRAEENAKKVAGHNKAGCNFGKARPGRLDGEQNDLKSVAGHDQQKAKKQCP